MKSNFRRHEEKCGPFERKRSALPLHLSDKQPCTTNPISPVFFHVGATNKTFCPLSKKMKKIPQLMRISSTLRQDYLFGNCHWVSICIATSNLYQRSPCCSENDHNQKKKSALGMQICRCLRVHAFLSVKLNSTRCHLAPYMHKSQWKRKVHKNIWSCQSKRKTVGTLWHPEFNGSVW